MITCNYNPIISFEVGSLSKLFKNKIASKHDIWAEISFPRNFVLFDAISHFIFLGKVFIHPRVFCFL